METPSHVSFASAVNSPSRFSLEGMIYYSAPTSPSRRVSSNSNAFFGSLTEPTSPRTYEDSNFNLDDFEFETSRPFDHISIDMVSKQEFHSMFNREKQPRGRHGSLPTMAFADELFCNGKVMPLAPPLKLPPCHHRGRNDSRSGNFSSTASSPSSPSSVLKLPFSRQCLWNDNFDPFMVALENVKHEKRGKSKGDNHRRARSSSPLRFTPKQKPNGSLDLSNEQNKQMGSPERPIQFTLSASTRWANVKQVDRSPIYLAEPKGLIIARQLENMNSEAPGKPNRTSPEPTVETGGENEVDKECGGSKKRVSKRLRFKKFLLRSLSSSSSRVNDEEKLNTKSVASRKPSLMRRFSSFKSEEQAQDCNGDKMVPHVAKMALVHYRPRFSLCLGYNRTP